MGASTTCAGSYTTTAADVTAGSLTNSATASASFGTQTVTSAAATATITVSAPPISVTIQYDYDDLYRLTAADYSNDDYYHYTYDAVGNRKTQERSLNGLVTNDTYNYDDANRLIDVNGVTYTWDNNGNLLNDGVNAYTYDAANRLKTMTSSEVAASYMYNGMGDRLQETVDGSTTTFTMDLNTGLTQALSDGTNTYVYGNERLAQVNTGTEYFLGDALGSVRQLTNATGAVSYASAYDPYGVTTQTYGASQSMYGYTNEYASQGLVYLRARHYVPGMGRFLTQDTWDGDVNQPMSFNRWMYVEGNPVNYFDPTGHIEENEQQAANQIVNELKRYLVNIKVDWGYYNYFDISRLGIQCGWNTGRWYLPELNIVKFAVERQDRILRNMFTTVMGPTTVAKVPNICGRGCTKENNIELLDDGKSISVGYSIEKNVKDDYVNFDAWSVVHEFGHVWNWKHGDGEPGRQLEKYTGGYTDPDPNKRPSYCTNKNDPDHRLPQCNQAGYHYGDIPAFGADDNLTRGEDFANSWAAYVFPDETQRVIAAKYNVPSLPTYKFHTYLYYDDYKQTLRWSYINNLVNGFVYHRR